MNSKTEVISPASRGRVVEKIVDFQPEQLKAPFLLRCGALFIDYIFFIAVPVLSLLIGRLFDGDGRKLLDGKISSAGWMIAFLIVLTNLVIFPMLNGQSIGKMLTGLRIIKTDGTSPTIPALLMRHLVGYPLIIFTGGLGFLISVVNSKGRALDDFVSGTMVIYGRRQVKEQKI